MMQENRLSLQITWHYISLHLAWRTQRWRREKKDGRGLHKCHGWKLRLRMERQRNSTSHQNILPSTAPLLRNTRDAAVRTAWLTNCPLCWKCSCTNIYSMHHWNSSKTRDWRTRHNRWSGWREECGQSSLQMGAVCDYGQVVLSACVRGIRLATAQTSCQLPSANPDVLRRQGAVSKTKWHHRDKCKPSIAI